LLAVEEVLAEGVTLVLLPLLVVLVAVLTKAKRLMVLLEDLEVVVVVIQLAKHMAEQVLRDRATMVEITNTPQITTMVQLIFG
jgi:predicted P-loop ATPase